MQVESSIHILFQLATKIKWISETELVTFMNRDYLQQIKYIDNFFNKFNYLHSQCFSFSDVNFFTFTVEKLN